ncbi:hypothetical protein QE152_g221 [Popillia japonica]|uniref:Uncharacterized protein n=1 Tax=Popillia japonica TaxID=7064 RepID=A0AAW1NL25_POPJA
MKYKQYYDMHFRERKDLEKEDNVTVLNRQKQWEAAQIVNKHFTPRPYLVKTENGNVLRRNRSHIRYSENLPTFKPNVENGNVLRRNRSHIRYSENLPTFKPNVSESSIVEPKVKDTSKDNSSKELDIDGNGTEERAIATSKPQRHIKLPERFKDYVM